MRFTLNGTFILFANSAELASIGVRRSNLSAAEAARQTVAGQAALRV